MKKLIFNLVLFLFAGSLFAQSGWQWINPLPQGNDLMCVDFLNPMFGFAGGAKGNVLKTTNGGLNWKLLNFNFDLKDIHYLSVIDTNIIYASGYYYSGQPGNLYKSSNGGNNWVLLSTTFNDISGLRFVNAETGFVSNGAEVRKTTDGGNNWTAIYISPAGSYGINQTYFLNDQMGFFFTGQIATHQHQIMRTTNSGINWSVCYETGTAGFFRDLQFINTNTGYVVSSDSKLLLTTNGGVNWNVGSSMPAAYSNSSSFQFINSVTGYMGNYSYDAFHKFSIYKTSNNGASWFLTAVLTLYEGQPISTGNISMKFLRFPSADTGYFVNNGGGVYKTINSGYNWSYQSSPWGNLGPLNHVDFPNISTGFCMGTNGSVFKTTDTGLNWSFSKLGNLTLYNSCFINGETGYIGTEDSRLYKTSNSGLSWDTLRVSSTLSPINSINFHNSQTGYVTNSYYIYKTTNSGLNWNRLSLEGRFICSSFINADTGYVGYSRVTGVTSYTSYIYKTINGGNNWELINVFPGSDGVELKFVSNDIGYVKKSGVLSKTVNGGLTWFPILSNGGDAYKIRTLAPNTVYIGSYKSTNGGTNWTLYNTKVQKINSIQYINDNTGFIVGGNGAGILRTTDGGEVITSVNFESSVNTKPNSFSLHQNYPNPFNPSTRINYELKITNYVSLKIFDLLGKEIATLVNEKQNAGSYAVDFNSTEFNLPSGIYFYTLNAGEFKETRKMILVK